MPTKFHSEIHRRDEVTYLKLGGVIDEDNDLSALAPEVGPGPVVIDLADVERINSCGVRDWVNWLARLEKQGGQPVLVECSPSIVAQVNLVNNFTGSGVVRSFYAPYFCPKCDREKVLLIDAAAASGQPRYRAPTCRCEECDGPMDFDDMEDSYFAFLASSAKVATDRRVEKVITEFTPSETGPRLRSRSNPGVSPAAHALGTLTPGLGSLPSMASLPSLPSSGGRRGVPEPYTAVTTGRHLLSPSGSMPIAQPLAAGTSNGASAPTVRFTPGRGVAIADGEPSAAADSAPPTLLAAQRGWLLLVGLLLAAALVVMGYLVLGSAAPASSAAPPSPRTTAR